MVSENQGGILELKFSGGSVDNGWFECFRYSYFENWSSGSVEWSINDVGES